MSLLLTAIPASAESPEQIEKRNQEFDENERQLKKQLYGAEKPWDLLVPYGADIHLYNYRRTYPQVYDKEEAEKRQREREANEPTEAGKDLSKQKFDERKLDYRRHSKISEYAKLLKIACDANELEAAQTQYAELRKLNWNDFEAQIDYALFLKSRKLYSQARDAIKNALPYWNGSTNADWLNKQFQMDLNPKTDFPDLSLPDDEFKTRRPRNRVLPNTGFVGKKQS